MFYQRYEPLNLTGAEAFANCARQRLSCYLGRPAIPVAELHLRRSIPLAGYDGLRRDFQLCEIVDRAKGIFAIYVSAEGDTNQLYGQLGHELGHLRDADVITDAYAEGACTWFASVMFNEMGRDWTAHENYFRSNASGPYGPTYQLLRALDILVGVPAIATLFDFAETQPSGRKEIAVDRWVATLPNAPKIRAEIIGYSDMIKPALPSEWSFRLPKTAS